MKRVGTADMAVIVESKSGKRPGTAESIGFSPRLRRLICGRSVCWRSYRWCRFARLFSDSTGRPGRVPIRPATKQMIETGDYADIWFQDEARYKKPIGIY